MSLNPGSSASTTVVSTTATPQTITPAGLAAAEFFNITNLGPGPAIVSWWDLRGIQLSGGPIANSITLWAGATGGLPWPSGGALTLSSSVSGTVNVTVQS